jgi:chemotaxis protein methyltransferase CheR
MDIQLAEGIVSRVRAALAEHAGLEPPAWVLEARLAERMKALALDRPEAYADLITSDGGRELELLVETLRVGETRFFRHPAHIAALTRVVVPALMSPSRRGNKVRVWSAGCASGEEAYTLAMVLGRHLGDSVDLEVLATDISDDALEVAQGRVYPEAAVASVPPSIQPWAFEPGPRPGTLRITDAIASRVRFEQHNLGAAVYPRGFDAIWCRNVLIYFTPEARGAAVERLIASLNAGGFLFVGYAETLRDFAALETVRTPDAVLYRKAARPVHQDRRVTPVPAPPASATASRSHRPGPRAAVVAEEAVVELRGRYDSGDRLTSELSPAIAGPYRRVRIELDGAEYLGDDAAPVLRRAISAARAAGVELRLVADRPGTQRWLRRWGLEE